MNDIVERARLAAAPGGWGHANQELLGQLADEIERLRAEIGRLYAERPLGHVLCIRQENI